MIKYKIKVYDPIIGNEEKKYINRCLNTNWISSRGKFIEEFEKKFSNYVNAKYSISVNNGTAALHVALLAIDLKKNDEVIVPTYTYIAPVNAIKYVGAKVKFIDSNLSNWQLDELKFEKAITKKTKAVVVPHLYGQMCNIQKIKNICKKRKIYLIEDCAQAFGCFYNNKHLGTFGDISTFSFFGSKTITTGEGGMVITNNKIFAKKIYNFKTVGVMPNKNYWHNVIGYNYRMTNLCAAIGLGQINKAKKIIKNKIRVYKIYKKFLNNNKNIKNINHEIKNSKSSFWLITIFLKNKKIRNKLALELKKNKIETRFTFFPIHTLPMYYNKSYKNLFPNAKKLCDTGLSLPSSPNLKTHHIKKITTIINKITDK